MNDKPRDPWRDLSFPLLVAMPLALLVLVAAATWWSYLAGRRQASASVRQEAIRDLTWTAANLESMFERAFRLNDRAAVQEEIAALASNSRFRFAVIVNEQGRVLHSMRRAHIGRQLDELIAESAIDVEVLERANLTRIQLSKGGKVEAVGDGHTIVAAYPLILGGESGQLRPTRVGNFILIDDYTAATAVALRAVADQALRFFALASLLAAGLGLFFHFAVTRRLKRLAQVAHQFGLGQRQVQSGIRGRDEVGDLARSIDRMMIVKTAADKERDDINQRLEAILEAAIDAIITINERGLVQTVNRATRCLFGYEPAEILGQNICQLMPSPYQEEHDGYLANYLATGEEKIIGIGREVLGRHKDGTAFPIDLSVSEVPLRDQRLFLGVVRDLRDRKRAEEEATSLGRILEDSLNEVYIFAADTLRFLRVNRGARENLGYSMDELSRLTPLDIKPALSAESFAQLVEPLRSGAQERITFDTFHRRKDGSDYDVEVYLQRGQFQAEPCFVAIILDVTERRQRAAAMELLSTRLQLAVDAGEIGLWDWTLKTNEVFLSDIWKSHLGYASHELENRLESLESHLHPQDRERVMRNLQQAIASDSLNYEGEFRLRHKNGSYRWILARGVVLRDAEGQPYRMVGSILDFTDRKQNVDELARLNAELESRVQERSRQLEQAQQALVRKERLAVLGQLAGSVAHEIRNPMGVIRNAVYYLQQVQSTTDADAKDALDEISRGLTNSERIVSELLDYARGPSTEASWFPLDEALTIALEMVSMPKSVRVERPATLDTRICADRGQVERLLANLIQNAVQAMPEGGTLSLKSDTVNGRVVTEVCDTGVGIAADELEKVFEPLFSKRAKGIGLGLALCRRYAELNGGSLDVESTPGRGSTFRVTLPLRDEAEQ